MERQDGDAEGSGRGEHRSRGCRSPAETKTDRSPGIPRSGGPANPFSSRSSSRSCISFRPFQSQFHRHSSLLSFLVGVLEVLVWFAARSISDRLIAEFWRWGSPPCENTTGPRAPRDPKRATTSRTRR